MMIRGEKARGLILLTIVFFGSVFCAFLAVGFYSSVHKKPNITILSKPKEDFIKTNFKSAEVFHAGRMKEFSNPEKMIAATFRDLFEKEKNWTNFEGRYLLANIWATWCTPCVVELPALEKLGHIFANKNFEVIAISVDFNLSSQELRAFLDKRNLGDFAAFVDHKGEIQQNIPMRGIPTTFLLSPKGKLLYVFEGDIHWDSPPSIAFFDKLLQQSR